MGELFRRFWHPVLLTAALPAPDGIRCACGYSVKTWWPSATPLARSASLTPCAPTVGQAWARRTSNRPCYPWSGPGSRTPNGSCPAGSRNATTCKRWKGRSIPPTCPGYMPRCRWRTAPRSNRYATVCPMGSPSISAGIYATSTMTTASTGRCSARRASPASRSSARRTRP